MIGKASKVDAECEASVTRADKIFDDFPKQDRRQLLGADKNFFKTVQYLRHSLEKRHLQVSPAMSSRVQEVLKHLTIVVAVIKAYKNWTKRESLSSCF